VHFHTIGNALNHFKRGKYHSLFGSFHFFFRQTKIAANVKSEKAFHLAWTLAFFFLISDARKNFYVCNCRYSSCII